VVLAVGCGGASPRQATPPKLPRALAQRWAAEADNVAAAVQANDGCGAQQLARTLAAEVAGSTARIPARLRSSLSTATATLAGRISCVSQPQPEPKGPKPKPPKDGKGPHGHDQNGDGG
jgi:hypothetical protein